MHNCRNIGNELNSLCFKMESPLSQSFSNICGELCNILYVKEYDKTKVNALIDELNAKPYKAEIFVRKPDAVALLSGLCSNITPIDGFMATKASHLITSVVTKQNLMLTVDNVVNVLAWHVECMKKCSGVVMLDILHNMQCLLQYMPEAGIQFTDDLIGNQGLLLQLIDSQKPTSSNQNPYQITLLSLKCIGSITSVYDEKSNTNIIGDHKDKISQAIVSCLMKGCSNSQDHFLYFKIVVAGLRVLTQLFFTYPTTCIPLPEVIGICRHYLLLGLVDVGTKPERVLPSQQSIAPMPVLKNTKGGKKQKVRKQRNNAIESLKKDIPVSDRSLMRDIDNIERSSAYKPASQCYLDAQARAKTNVWTLTSDSDLSDIESGREAKLVALKSRVRQSASNLLLAVVKVTEKKEMFGYWWGLLPDAPDTSNWACGEAAKKTLAYCAVTDPISTSRASVLSVILALLSGSKQYLFQAESCTRGTSSFTPFSVSLGYLICCLHKVLVSILESERIHSVVIVALKCMAALVQATPYHKMKEGLVTEVVRSTRKYLIHRDVTLQVGALITMGCVLSIDPKVDEVLKSIEKAQSVQRMPSKLQDLSISPDDECDDFEEEYSDDEIFVVEEKKQNVDERNDEHNFRSWILDICLKNLGWVYRGNQLVQCKSSVIPVMLESLQVLSAMSFHYFTELISDCLSPLSEALCHALQHEHRDVVLHAATTVSVLADATRVLEQTNKAPPLSQCVRMWERLLPPLSGILQGDDLPPAKAVACDCIANIGERTFKELPRHVQVLCCALLVGSCGAAEDAVRAAAVRALAMAVAYPTLREDICFVSDCGENILRALSEPSLVVRAKAAWALGNLSDALVVKKDDPDIDDIDDDLLLRLLEASVQCAVDNDKVKMSATRGIGNLLRLVNSDTLARAPRLKSLCETAIEKLVDCACKVANMKVRWNACYAIGNAMKNADLFVCFTRWQRQVFLSLCTQSQDCKNIKVRINAATALRSPSTREQFGEQFAPVWRGLMIAMENALNIDDFNEYKHKDNLIEQLFVTLAHMCCLLQTSDLHDIYDHLVFHHDSAKTLSTQLCHILPPDNASCIKILEAAKHITVALTANTDTQRHALAILHDLFIWDL